MNDKPYETNETNPTNPATSVPVSRRNAGTAPEDLMDADLFADWDEELSGFSMEKINGGWAAPCPRCDGTGVDHGKLCYSCGGSGWRR